MKFNLLAESCFPTYYIQPTRLFRRSQHQARRGKSIATKVQALFWRCCDKVRAWVLMGALWFGREVWIESGFVPGSNRYNYENYNGTPVGILGEKTKSFFEGLHFFQEIRVQSADNQLDRADVILIYKRNTDFKRIILLYLLQTCLNFKNDR